LLTFCCNSPKEDTVTLLAGEETFTVHKNVLARHSEYFETSFKPEHMQPDGTINLDDVNPQYLAYYIGVSYSFSTILPHTPPVPAANPEAHTPSTSLRDFIGVHQLCDRFLAREPVMDFIAQCCRTAIGNNHRALFRAPHDDELHQRVMRDFADAFEVLQDVSPREEPLRFHIIQYFVEGVNFHL
jgi:hypothetical protein